MLEDGLNKAEDMLYERASFAIEVSAVYHSVCFFSNRGKPNDDWPFLVSNKSQQVKIILENRFPIRGPLPMKIIFNILLVRCRTLVFI